MRHRGGGSAAAHGASALPVTQTVALQAKGDRRMTASSRAGRPDHGANQPHGARPVSPLAGIVAGTVLRAARLSAGISEARLARLCGTSERAICSWEDGSRPLASVPHPRVARLKAVLTTLGADPRIVADFDAAAWCDLFLLGVAGSGDTTCLLADPVAVTGSFREMLDWCLTGSVPDRYRSYAAPGPLLVDAALIELATGILDALPGSAGVRPTPQ